MSDTVLKYLELNVDQRAILCPHIFFPPSKSKTDAVLRVNRHLTIGLLQIQLC